MKYIYDVCSFHQADYLLISILNERGNQGWRLVQAIHSELTGNYTLIFIKELP